MLSIRIKKRGFLEWTTLFVSLFPIFFGSLTEFLPLPASIRFLVDIAIAVSIGIVVIKAFYTGSLGVLKEVKGIGLLVLTFFLYTLITYLFHFDSPFYYIWGFRNNFRFYFAFFLFVAFMQSEDVDACLKVFDAAFWVHVIATVVQYFMGFEQDCIGGIFGVKVGCNGYALVFISIVVAKSLLVFMNGNEKLLKCFMKCAAALLTASLAEIKIFFICFVVIVVVAAVVTRFSFKKTLLILTVAIMFLLAYTLLTTIYDNFQNFLSLESLLEELLKENYANAEDIGRFTAIRTIREKFFPSFVDRLFGMGLGNCDTSTIDIFNTDFAEQYIGIHYSIFSVAFLFIETGYIGLFLYTVLFVFVFVYSLLNYRKGRGNPFYNQMGMIMSILCVILMHYNSSLRTEAGYMIYFILALPYIGAYRSPKIPNVLSS